MAQNRLFGNEGKPIIVELMIVWVDTAAKSP